MAAGGEAVVAALLAMAQQIAELERRLGLNSGNSGRPPSSDPPASRAERRRAARAAAKRSMAATGRNVGGQPGHRGAHRDQVADPDLIVEHAPESCGGCGGDLAGGELVDDAVCHQVWELPETACVVSEHQRLRVLCEGCGRSTLADLPPGIPAGAFGPRLCATIVGLCAHMSREQVAVFVTDNFGCPISAASVEAICKRVSRAIEGTWEQLAGAIREQPVVHADETGWRWPRQHHRQAWVASTREIAVYLLAETRASSVAKQLLGKSFKGILISDRYAGYNWIDPAQRQFCWPHLLRDYQALADRSGRTATLGRALKKTSQEILHVYHQHEAKGRQVAWDSPELLALHNRLLDLFEQGSRMRDAKTSRFCNGLLKLWPALWNFTENPGVDPSNNRAERALRFAVLLRKRSGGTRTDHGDRFIERLLTVRETCRLQRRSLHDYLLDAITAALHGQTAPSLLPAGP